MQRNAIIGGIVVVVVIAAIAAFAWSANAPMQTSASTTIALATTVLGNQTTIQTTIQSTTTTLGPQFNSTQYATSAYQIYPAASLSQNGKIATSDFNASSILLPGAFVTVYINFTDTKASYNVTLNPGYKLYFIDSSLGDDSPAHDGLSSDDGYAIVDQNGYLVSMKYPLPKA